MVCKYWLGYVLIASTSYVTLISLWFQQFTGMLCDHAWYHIKLRNNHGRIISLHGSQLKRYVTLHSPYDLPCAQKVCVCGAVLDINQAACWVSYANSKIEWTKKKPCSLYGQTCFLSFMISQFLLFWIICYVNRVNAQFLVNSIKRKKKKFCSKWMYSFAKDSMLQIILILGIFFFFLFDLSHKEKKNQLSSTLPWIVSTSESEKWNFFF